MVDLILIIASAIAITVYAIIFILMGKKKIRNSIKISTIQAMLATFVWMSCVCQKSVLASIGWLLNATGWWSVVLILKLLKKIMQKDKDVIEVEYREIEEDGELKWTNYQTEVIEVEYREVEE